MTDSVLRVGFKVPDQVVDVNDELVDLGEEAGCFGEGGAGLAGVGEKVWLDLGLPEGGNLLEGRSHFIGGGPFDCLTQGNWTAARHRTLRWPSRSFSCPCAAVAVNREIDQPVADPAQAPCFVDRHHLLPWMRSAIRSEVPITITPIVAIPAMAMDVLLTIEWRQSGAGRVGMRYLVEIA